MKNKRNKMTKILFSSSIPKQHIAIKNEVRRAEICEDHTIKELKIVDSVVFPMLLRKKKIFHFG